MYQMVLMFRQDQQPVDNYITLDDLFSIYSCTERQLGGWIGYLATAQLLVCERIGYAAFSVPSFHTITSDNMYYMYYISTNSAREPIKTASGQSKY